MMAAEGRELATAGDLHGALIVWILCLQSPSYSEQRLAAKGTLR